MRKALVAVLVLMLATLILTGFASLVQAQGWPTMYIDPTPVTVTVSSDFTVAVNIMDVGYLCVWRIDILNFDPNLLECISVSEGPFLASVGTTVFYESIDNVAGSINAGCSLTNPLAGMASGSGTLAYVTFHCKGAGECDLILSQTLLIVSLDMAIQPVNVNGHVEQVPAAPVGGEWVPVNTIQMLVQLVGSIAAVSAIAASFVGFKRIRKKQN